MAATLYGLKNCDTCRKALNWLRRFDIEHAFVDYRDERQSPETLLGWKDAAGGWDAMAAALGFSRDGLENRIYERKGQDLHVQTALQMQSFSGTTLFAQAVATAAGGTFLQLPEVGEVCNEDISTKFHELYAELGELSIEFQAATKDGEIDKRERERINEVVLHHIGRVHPIAK